MLRVGFQIHCNPSKRLSGLLASPTRPWTSFPNW
ncbi:hypothetical protein C5167_010194 [Papaver somniferum]|uniref:Uncharacterized protein n=1 Tax=Papaver somniferum TaxID=3469 RepID=A0A4Y7K3F7_PAPSO|nr:hypothetical protein C5167_010194 [Papaver somniferum]